MFQVTDTHAAWNRDLRHRIHKYSRWTDSKKKRHSDAFRSWALINSGRRIHLNRAWQFMKQSSAIACLFGRFGIYLEGYKVLLPLDMPPKRSPILSNTAASRPT